MRTREPVYGLASIAIALGRCAAPRRFRRRGRVPAPEGGTTAERAATPARTRGGPVADPKE